MSSKKKSNNPNNKPDKQNDLVVDLTSLPEWAWERSLVFEIPGRTGVSGLQVKVTEVADGSLKFELEVLPGSTPRPDIQALFFDLGEGVDLDSLLVSGTHVSAFDQRDVIDVGRGMNVRGQPLSFDLGVGLSPTGRAGINVEATEFLLSSSTEVLTLDDIGGMNFATRINAIGYNAPVITAVAPHSPDAVDDQFTLFEDGVLDQGSPTHESNSVVFLPLVNDTDGDGDRLEIVALRGGVHGTVEIIDGPDSDDLPGDAVRYTPFADYSGIDSFEYLISDGNGGQDYARADLNIQAVADVPDMDLKVLATGDANQMILRVESTQTDLDFSEFIDRIELSATYTDGTTVNNLSDYLSEVVYDPASQSNSLAHDFLITLPAQTSTLFDLQVTGVSQETSNADEETATQTIRIETVARENSFSTVFKVDGQSIWSNGDAARTTQTYDLVAATTLPASDITSYNYSPIDVIEFGIPNVANFRGDFAVTLEASDVDIELSLRNTVTLEGGTIEADIEYDGQVRSLYNKTVDQLQFTTSASADMANSSFTAQSPGVLFEQKLMSLAISSGLVMGAGGYVTIDAPTANTYHFGDSIDIPVDLNASPLLGSSGLSLARFDGSTLHLLEGLYSVDSISGEKRDGLNNELFNWKLESPYFQTSNEAYNELQDWMYGENSDTFLTLTYDLDGIASSIKKITNPVSQSVSAGYSEFDITLNADLLDLDLVNQFSFLLRHMVEAKDLYGQFIFEDGSTQDFKFGDTVTLNDASLRDQNGDGVIDYGIVMQPDATLRTVAGADISFEDQLDILMASFSAPVVGTQPIGPAMEVDGTIIDKDWMIPAWSDTFALGVKSVEVEDLYA